MTLDKNQLNEITSILADLHISAYRLSTSKYQSLNPDTNLWSSMEIGIAEQLLRVTRILSNDITKSNHSTVCETIQRIRLATNQIKWQLEGADMAFGIDWKEYSKEIQES